MVTLVLTNRNRNLRIVENCLESLNQQTNTNFELFFVDYGSNKEYVLGLEQLISKYSKIQYIACPVSGQLWNKSRAINIALQKCETPYFFVADIDMLFHSNFVNVLYELKDERVVTYFKVGFLSKAETLLNKGFYNSTVEFVSQKEATGMTLYPTKLLKEINGYDEFYHGWGAEDTDVHTRLSSLGIKVCFYDKNIFLKHQWHPKAYRTNLSTDPYHFNLEKINHYYGIISQKNKQLKVNINNEWGLFPEQKLYSKLLSSPDYTIDIFPEIIQTNALLAQLSNFRNKVILINVKNAPIKLKMKQSLKKVLNKKHITFLSMRTVNDMFLQEVIIHYRNLPYHYSFDQIKNEISLKIYFQ